MMLCLVKSKTPCVKGRQKILVMLKVIERLTTSPEAGHGGKRQSLFTNEGSHHYNTLAYPAQLKFKQKLVSDLLPKGTSS